MSFGVANGTSSVVFKKKKKWGKQQKTFFTNQMGLGTRAELFF